MEVVLLEKVVNLGRVGDKVSVKPGYGRNFLVPQKKAFYATPENIKLFELKRAEYEQAQSDKLESARSRAEKLAAMEITLAFQADPSGKLYAPVSSRAVADAITKAGCEVRKEEVRLSLPIRQIGEHSINLQLHPEVAGSVLLKVVAVHA